MRELINDSFYDLIEKYDRCIIDYCLIEDDTPYLLLMELWMEKD